MYINIKTQNKELLSVLNKNPNTDSGLYLKPLRNGHIVGNCVSENEYEILFQDTKNSYTSYESNQTDYKSFCSPEVIVNVLTEFFPHLLKDKAEVENTSIPWLSKNIKEIDTHKCSVHIPNFLISSSWSRGGEFLLCKYFPELSVTHIENSVDVYSLSIEAQNIFEAINLLALVSFLTAVSNDREFYIQEAQVGKYIRVLTNIKSTPYFVYYLFIKRCCTRSPNVFNKYVKVLQDGFSLNSGLEVTFTINDTHRDRMMFVKEHINMEKPVINFGVEGLQYEKYFGRRFKSRWVSYDIEDYSEDYEVVSKNYTNFDWKFTMDLNLIDKSLEYQVIVSEVLEHCDLEEFKKEMLWLKNNLNVSKIIITTPNKSFNKYYNMEDHEVRREDHIKELTYEEFVEYIKIIDNKAAFYKIGDCVNGECVTSAAILL